MTYITKKKNDSKSKPKSKSKSNSKTRKQFKSIRKNKMRTRKMRGGVKGWFKNLMRGSKVKLKSLEPQELKFQQSPQVKPNPYSNNTKVKKNPSLPSLPLPPIPTNFERIAPNTRKLNFPPVTTENFSSSFSKQPVRSPKEKFSHLSSGKRVNNENVRSNRRMKRLMKEYELAQKKSEFQNAEILY